MHFAIFLLTCYAELEGYMVHILRTWFLHILQQQARIYQEYHVHSSYHGFVSNLAKSSVELNSSHLPNGWKISSTTVFFCAQPRFGFQYFLKLVTSLKRKLVASFRINYLYGRCIDCQKKDHMISSPVKFSMIHVWKQKLPNKIQNLTQSAY